MEVYLLGQWAELAIRQQTPYPARVHVTQRQKQSIQLAERPNEDPDRQAVTGGRSPIVTWALFQMICMELQVTGQIYLACSNHGTKYKLVDDAIKDANLRGDNEWQELWLESKQMFRESIEREAVRRHTEGVTKRIYNAKGDLISTEQVFSDRLGEKLLDGYFPERYRQNYEAGNLGLQEIDAFTTLSIEAKKQIRDIIVADMARQRELADASKSDDTIDAESKVVHE